MRLIQQRQNYDCAVACMAMLADVDYETVSSKFDPNRFDFDNEEDILNDLVINVVMKDLGYKVLQAGHDFYWSSPSIVIVPSLNHRGLDHAVCYDGEGNIYDPMSGKEGMKAYDFELFKVSPKFNQFIRVDHVDTLSDSEDDHTAD